MEGEIKELKTTEMARVAARFNDLRALLSARENSLLQEFETAAGRQLEALAKQRSTLENVAAVLTDNGAEARRLAAVSAGEAANGAAGEAAALAATAAAMAVDVPSLSGARLRFDDGGEVQV